MEFTDDLEKMIDFVKLSKEEFLKSYSYLTDDDYEATLRKVKNKETISKYFIQYMNDIYKRSPETVRLTKEIIKIQNVLYETLTDEQVKMIDEINKLEGHRTKEMNKNVWVNGVSFCCQMIFEGLSK